METFSAASGPVFLFCAPKLVFGGAKGVGSRFQALRTRTRFRWFRGRRVPFSYFALPDKFSVVARASGPIFIFYSPGLVFGDTKGIEPHFHVLRIPIHFRRYRRRPLLFSCFALTNTFSPVRRASSHVFRFRVTKLIFCGTDDVRSRFHVLRSRTRIRLCEGRQFPFPCFVLPYLFSAVPRASCLVFMFCAPGLVLGGSEVVGSRFHIFAPGHIFCGSEGVGSRFHVLRPRTRIRR
jgi:hypothetical protein